MREGHPSTISKLIHRLLPVLIVVFLAGCGAPQEPPLTIPTQAATAVVPATTEPTVESAAEPTAEPAPAQPTATLPPPPTVLPTVRPTSPPATPTPTAPPQPAAAPAHQVAFVTANDTLNVRSGPGIDYPPVAALAPDADGIVIAAEGQSIIAGSTWIMVETDGEEGWVNSRFLTESVDRETFCTDPAVSALLLDLETAMATADGGLLQRLVHPERGLRLRVNWWNEEIFLTGREVSTLFSGRPSFDWGFDGGSGMPITGSFAKVMLPQLERDMLGATKWACDELVGGPTAGAVVLPEGYEQLHFYSAHRAAPAEMEFDWGTWAIGIDRWEGNYYLSYLIHYRYEI